jgi:hypothetical protein
MPRDARRRLLASAGFHIVPPPGMCRGSARIRSVQHRAHPGREGASTLNTPIKSFSPRKASNSDSAHARGSLFPRSAAARFVFRTDVIISLVSHSEHRADVACSDHSARAVPFATLCQDWLLTGSRPAVHSMALSFAIKSALRHHRIFCAEAHRARNRIANRVSVS